MASIVLQTAVCGMAVPDPGPCGDCRAWDPIVPLILERKRIRGGHWYHTLHSITQATRSTLPTTATSQRSSKLGCVGAGTMDASEGTDELADLFPKLAAQGFEIVEPPRIGITASRSRPAIPARGGASTHPTTGVPTRRGRTASPIWWRCLPGWTSSDAVTAGPSPTLGRSRCTNNRVHGHMPPCRRPTGRGAARWVTDPSSNTTTRRRSPVGPYGNPTIYMRRTL